MRHQLEVVDGAQVGRRIPVRGEFLLGRAAEADGRFIEDRDISRRHARLVSDPDGGLVIEDLNSANGTWVNGQRIVGAQPVRDGDRIRIGATTLLVNTEQPPPPPPPPPRPAPRPDDATQGAGGQAAVAGAGDQLKAIEGKIVGRRLNPEAELILGRAAEGEGNLGEDREASRPVTRSRAGRPRITVGIVLGAAALLVLVLLLIGQMVLPALAKSRITSQLAERGDPNADVEVKAFPAVKMLFGVADEVTVRADTLRAANEGQSGSVSDGLSKTGGVKKLDASVQRLVAGSLTLRDVSVTKEGGVINAQASVSESAVRRGLPEGFDVRPRVTPAGQLLLEGEISALGFDAQANARLLTRNGGLVLQPEADLPFGPPGGITVFQDEGIDIREIKAKRSGNAFTVSGEAIVK